ncbi:MAG: putative metalloprotease CJM1_0395 family protein, partial [Myxococcota bacterium]|nr:putative metalloprotease CJM1_0395 family protein [Myxococcota bacterium]
VYGAPTGGTDESRESPADQAEAERIQEASPGGQLTPDEEQVVAELRSRDAEVRSHEAAHMAAGGGLTGGMSLSYQVGPDGKRYAVGGEVSIDASPGKSPEETARKAQRIRAAALAPAEPSAQDRSVAARAGQMEADARSELRQQRAAELRDTLQGLQPGEESDGFPPKTVTLGEVEGLQPDTNVVELPPLPDESNSDPAVEAAVEPRGESVDLMAIFEKVTGGEDGVFGDASDETDRRLGGRLSGFGNGTAADAQMSGMTAPFADAYRALQDPQSQAYSLVA